MWRFDINTDRKDIKVISHPKFKDRSNAINRNHLFLILFILFFLSIPNSVSSSPIKVIEFDTIVFVEQPVNRVLNLISNNNEIITYDSNFNEIHRQQFLKPKFFNLDILLNNKYVVYSSFKDGYLNPTTFDLIYCYFFNTSKLYFKDIQNDKVLFSESYNGTYTEYHISNNEKYLICLRHWRGTSIDIYDLEKQTLIQSIRTDIDLSDIVLDADTLYALFEEKVEKYILVNGEYELSKSQYNLNYTANKYVDYYYEDNQKKLIVLNDQIDSVIGPIEFINNTDIIELISQYKEKSNEIAQFHFLPKESLLVLNNMRGELLGYKIQNDTIIEYMSHKIIGDSLYVVSNILNNRYLIISEIDKNTYKTKISIYNIENRK